MCLPPHENRCKHLKYGRSENHVQQNHNICHMQKIVQINNYLQPQLRALERSLFFWEGLSLVSSTTLLSKDLLQLSEIDYRRNWNALHPHLPVGFNSNRKHILRMVQEDQWSLILAWILHRISKNAALAIAAKTLLKKSLKHQPPQDLPTEREIKHILSQLANSPALICMQITTQESRIKASRWFPCHRWRAIGNRQ